MTHYQSASLFSAANKIIIPHLKVSFSLCLAPYKVRTNSVQRFRSFQFVLNWPPQHSSNARWVNMIIRKASANESESQAEKSKMQLTKFGRGRGRKYEAGRNNSRRGEKKTAESQQHSVSKQTSNIIKHTEWDTLISMAPQEAGVFRKSSKCKLIYCRQRSWGAAVQPNSRHQRVKPNVCSSAHRDSSVPGSLSQPPTAKPTGTTLFYAAERVRVNISSSLSGNVRADRRVSESRRAMSNVWVFCCRAVTFV